MMVSKPVVRLRDTKKEDGPHLIKWLMQPGVLKGFPMVNHVEVKDAVRIWMEHMKKGASMTALHKKTPAGCASLYIHDVEKLKHQCLFVIIVDEKYRGQGIGTLLINSLEKRAKQRFGVELLHLEVYVENPAIALYERLGFSRYGIHKGFLKEPDGQYCDKVLMQKSLVD